MVLDNSQANYMESLIFACFNVNIMDLISVKAQLTKSFNQPPVGPNSIDAMPFWEFELYMKELERLVDDENKQQQDEFNKSGASNAMNMARNPDKFMASQQKNMMPKMPNMNMPSTIKMPTYH